MTLAERLTETPSLIEDDLYSRLRETFGEEGLVELTSAIAWKNYLARFNRTFNVDESDWEADPQA